MNVIFDLDGTLADVEHRRHYVRGRPRNFDAFNAACVHDPVIEPVAMINRMLRSAGAEIYIFSGRSSDVYDETVQWLHDNDIKYHHLKMRPSKDYRPDDELKQMFLNEVMANGWVPDMVFDDRNQVVDMWRRNGIVCAQVAPGNF